MGAHLTFFGLISIADDDGRFVATPRYVLGSLYAHRPTYTEADVEQWLIELMLVDTIRLYIIHDVMYGFFPKWKTYQRINHPTPSRLPQPPANLCRASYKVPSIRGFTKLSQTLLTDVGNTSHDLWEHFSRSLGTNRAEEEEEGEKEEEVKRIRASAGHSDLNAVTVSSLIEPEARSSLFDYDEAPLPDEPPPDDAWDDDAPDYDWQPDDELSFTSPEVAPTTRPVDRPTSVSPNGNGSLAATISLLTLLNEGQGHDPTPEVVPSSPQASPGATEGSATPEGGESEPLRDPSASDKPTKPPTRAERETEAYAAEFLDCWAVYPRKIARAAALKKYIACRRRGNSAEDLLVATKAYAAECERNGTEQKFIKHGETFYGPSEHWLDYVPKRPEPKSAALAKPISPEANRGYEDLLARSPYDLGADEVGAINGTPVDTCTWSEFSGTWIWVLSTGISLWVSDDPDGGKWTRSLWNSLPARRTEGVAIGSGDASWVLVSRPLDPVESAAAAAMQNECFKAARGEREKVLDTPVHAHTLYARLLTEAAASLDSRKQGALVTAVGPFCVTDEELADADVF